MPSLSIQTSQYGFISIFCKEFSTIYLEILEMFYPDMSKVDTTLYCVSRTMGISKYYLANS